MSDPRYSIVVGGPPGTGKSSFAASVADVVGAEHTLALCCKPNEANSWGYTSRGIKTELFYDPGWKPSIKKFNARAYLSLSQRLWSLLEDDDQYDAIILDPFTDAAEIAGHELLKKDSASTPREAADSQGYYGELKAKLAELATALRDLQYAKRPKHVIVTVHLQPAKEEVQLTRAQGGGTKPHADKRAQGAMFEGMILPAFDGSYKYRFGGDFDCVLYSDIRHEITRREQGGRTVMQKEPRYVIQVQPNAEFHAKVRVAPSLKDATLDNNFAALLAAIGNGGGK